jgi:DNA primase
LGLIPDDKIAEVRDRTDIVALIGEYVSLRRAGTNWKGLCPFHNEKSPSFNVNPSRQFFHCFGCGKSGDVFSFLQEIEGKSFIEAARELAAKAGVELPEPRSPREVERAREADSERAHLVRLHELVASFYEECLASEAGAAARAYLASRGLSETAQKTFRVGYAPAGWEALVRHLAEKRVPAELAERAGLIRRRERAGALPPNAPPSKQTHFDVFVDRVVYTLTSPVGEPIGFGGRVLPGAPPDQPKYKNSPETLLYKKGENLFGLHVAKHAIRKSGRALVVEGNFDVMTLHDVGINYAVAPQGTAITEAQVALLGRFAKEVVLMLDADPAGRAATMKVIRLFLEADLPVKVTELRARDGKKQDPDELARRDLPRLQEIIDKAVDGVRFAFEQIVAASEPTVPGKVRAVEECAPLLRSVRHPLARDAYIAELADLLRLDVAAVQRAIRSAVAAPQATAPTRRAQVTAGNAGKGNGAPAPTSAVEKPAARPVAPRPIDRPLANLLALLAQHGTLLAAVTPAVVDSVADPEVKVLLASTVARGRFEANQVLAEAAPSIKDAVARSLMSDEYRADVLEIDPRRALDDILAAITRPRERQRLEEERRLALARNDHARFAELSIQLKKLSILSNQSHTSRRGP